MLAGQITRITILTNIWEITKRYGIFYAAVSFYTAFIKCLFVMFLYDRQLAQAEYAILQTLIDRSKPQQATLYMI